DQPLARRAVLLDRPRGRYVIGGDAVTQHRHYPGALDRLDRARLGLHVLEEAWLAHVGGVGPGVAVALRGVEVAPAVVAGEHVGVALLEHVLANRVGDRLLDLLRGRPDVR